MKHIQGKWIVILALFIAVAALSAFTLRGGDKPVYTTQRVQQGDIRQLGKDDYAFRLWYRDGLETASFMTNGIAQDAATAVEVEGRAEPVATLMWLQEGEPFQHFACLVKAIEKMFETGEPTYPVERTLLTSGVLEAILTSKFEGHKRIETPHLAVRYMAARKSSFCTEKL